MSGLQYKVFCLVKTQIRTWSIRTTQLCPLVTKRHLSSTENYTIPQWEKAANYPEQIVTVTVKIILLLPGGLLKLSL